MKIKNYVTIREKREKLMEDTWIKIEKYIIDSGLKVQSERVRRWYDLENQRLKRPEYQSQFDFLIKKMIRKINLYLNNRQQFEVEHENLLVELEIDRDKIYLRDEDLRANELKQVEDSPGIQEAKAEIIRLKKELSTIKNKIKEYEKIINKT